MNFIESIRHVTASLAAITIGPQQKPVTYGLENVPAEFCFNTKLPLTAGGSVGSKRKLQEPDPNVLELLVEWKLGNFAEQICEYVW